MNSFKRLFSVILIFAMLVPMMFVTSAATVSGTDAGISWSLNGNRLTISGIGEMPAYSPNGAPWYPYADIITEVVIEDGVKSIGSYAFNLHKNLTSVTLAHSITDIHDFAFHGCSSLADIVIHEGVARLGSSAFFGCNIKDVVIPDSVTIIGEKVFGGCTALESVYIGSGLVSTGRYTFIDCTSLNSVVFSNTVASIDISAFNGCVSLSEFTVPESVTSIGDYAFAGCSLLSDITVHNGVTHIGTDAFARCDALTINCSVVSYAYGYAIENGIPVNCNDSISSVSVKCLPAKTVYPVNGYLDTDGLVLEVICDDSAIYNITSGYSVAEYDFSSAGIKTITVEFRGFTVTFDVTVESGVVDYPESVHPYEANFDKTWVYTHPTPANELKVTFSSDTYLESYKDFLYVTDDNNMRRFTAGNLAGKTIDIIGNSFTLRLTSNASIQEYGFRITNIDSVSYEPTLSSQGVQLTVHGLHDVKDFFIAEGEHMTYRQVKDNLIAGVTAAKLGNSTEFTYMVKKHGIHTVYIRYNDGSAKVLYADIVGVEPDFSGNGLQLTINNLENVKVIRTAYGEFTTVREIKNSATHRAFTAKNEIKGSDSYKIQYRDNGIVTVAVVYNDGYEVFYHYNVQKKIPTVEQKGDTVVFGNLDGLYNVRYAKGEYTTTSQIKAAEGSVALKANKIDEYGNITVRVKYAGIYTFCVQYDDESFNYFVLNLDGEPEPTPEPEPEPEPMPEPEPEPVIMPTATGVHVSCAFSDNMILQRDEKLSVWGTANAGSGNVVVTLGEKTASATVDSLGNWKATFDDTFSYTTEGQPLVVKGADDEITFKNVLIGDVYYIVGQSNVFYSLGELMIDLRLLGRSDQLTTDFDDNRDIRFYRISSTDYMNMAGVFAQGTTTLYTDVYSGAYWMKPTDIANQILTYANFTPAVQTYDRTTVSMNVFSAIGYQFAYNMSEKTDVPCGVIEIDASGHPLITFAPNELADKWGHDTMDASGRYYYKLGDTAMNTTLKTRYAYNQQIHPLSNFSCAGIIWYQGESDQYNTREMFGSKYNNGFADQFAELMTYFRSTFGNDDFDVYMFEYPVCYYNNGSNAFMDFGAVRTELGTIPQILSDCHIVSSSDLFWDVTWWNNIHPPIKHLNAIRLAEIVAADKFNIGNIDDVSGPVLNNVVYEGSKVTLMFDHAGAGLETADNSGNVIGLEILVIQNGVSVWMPVSGSFITGVNELTIDAGVEIFGVRYGRAIDSAHPFNRNLCNAYKMPAVAFVDYK